MRSSSNIHADSEHSLESSGSAEKQSFLPAGPSDEEMSKRLSDLRRELEDAKVDCYVVPSEDEHQSEEVAIKDKRREWISRFDGSAGTAIIPRSTSSKALLFVDSRYWLQAEQQINKEEWTVVRVGSVAGSGPASVLSGWTDWAVKDAEDGSRIGIDPRLISSASADSLLARLEDTASRLVPITCNLVDRVRTLPPQQINALKHHPVSFSGETTLSKLYRLRTILSDKVVSGREWAYVLPALPPIAWLLNMRCEGDVPFCPVGFAYVVLTREKCLVFVDEAKVVDEELKKDWKEAGVEVRKYGIEEVGKALKDIEKKVKADEKKSGMKVWTSASASWALKNVCESFQAEIIPCPVTITMAVKNATEQEGFRQAYLRDGRAMVRWIAWLEGLLLKEKREVGEWAAVQTLTRYRRQEDHFAGLAYEDISASGPNGALAHYHAKRGQDMPVGVDAPYVVDSGAQYLDGTIDTTRTIYFGNKPSDEIKRAYTRVLQGHMAVAQFSFPEGMDASWMNMLARAPLFEDGLEFGHGLGHGVGSYLGVHEYPVSFPHGFSFQPGHVTTVEPGYYKEGEFGIRIENLYLCKDKDPKSTEKKWYEWERMSQVPIQTSLVDWSIMSKDQIKWLNAHHTDVENALMPLLDQGDQDKEARDWLKKACKPRKIWPWTR
ncbi:peptidase M24, structural domain-containing protein [Dioszegia hungarica]|uniref:Peptidase M24, structural domain-containing protein n=1 Tax=Dioszegia hungarica TaxID=4972 RepID=A0AA38LX86_9TREE|nr:peptidase M24, structural domain-containing protein [Dioszegia hungarica]KAI9637649.1 peptidase M24, structural domain-containing protein [Dioszegia hungarica]